MADKRRGDEDQRDQAEPEEASDAAEEQADAQSDDGTDARAAEESEEPDGDGADADEGGAASEQQGQNDSKRQDRDDQDDEATAAPPKKLSPGKLVAEGRRALQELMGRRPETVSGLERTGDGWRVTLEVLEMSRIPPTTDVLATYQVDLTEDGDLLGYKRVRRYFRNQAEGRE